MRGLLPLGNRKYFNVVKEKFDEETYRALKAEYAKLTKVPADAIVIFAITDPQKRQTFLLPEFFGLKPIEQAAILFHEAYWVIKPNATYDEVVRGEIAFQKHIEARAAGGYEYTLAGCLQNMLYKMDIELSMHLNEDLATGALAELGADPESGLPLLALMSPDLHCAFHDRYHLGHYRGAVVAGAGQFAFTYDLAQRYPDSNLLRFLLAKQADGILMTFGLHERLVSHLLNSKKMLGCYQELKTMGLNVRSGRLWDASIILN